MTMSDRPTTTIGRAPKRVRSRGASAIETTAITIGAGRNARARRQRRELEHLLEVQDREEHEPEGRADHERLREVRPGHVAGEQDAQRDQRRGGLGLADEEPGEQDDGEGAEAQGAGGGQAVALALDQGVHAEHQSGGHEGRADHVGSGFQADAAVGGQQLPGHRGHDEAEREVHVEDRFPTERLGEHAAHDAPRGAAAGGGEAVEADGLHLVLRFGEDRDDHAQEAGGRDRAADALHEAGGQQEALAVGQRGADRGEGEEGQSGEEHLLAADEVAEPSGEEQEAAEGDHIGVDGPHEVGLAEGEVLADGRERDADDVLVQDDHDLGGRQGDHREPSGSKALGCNG